MSATGSAARRPFLREHGPVFWIGVAAGWAVMAFGIWTLFRRAGATRPMNFGALFVGLALIHDLLLAPVVTVLAAWLGPRLPARERALVTGAAIVSGVLAIVALPPILGTQPADNPSLLPRHYPVGLVIALVSVWGVTGLAIALARLRSRRTG